MFTNDQAGCNHNTISIVIEQEEIQQFDINDQTLEKVYDDINLTEPIMIVCKECNLELKYDDITIEEFIATPLLNNESIDILNLISKSESEESDGEECVHDKVSLELYQLVQLILEKEDFERTDSPYKIKEQNFGEKEIYLTCDLCSTILYEYFDAELENLNNGDDSDDDLFIADEDEDEDDEDNFTEDE